MTTYDFYNLRFTSRPVPGATYREGTVRHDLHAIDVSRISDGRPLLPQGWFPREPTPEELAEFALSWVLKKAGNNAPPPTYCKGCHAVLQPVFGDTDVQFQNALEVSFNGGYAMFIDPAYGPPDAYKALICHECSHDLAEKVPWIWDMLQPHRSHTHTAEYEAAHPDHVPPDEDDGLLRAEDLPDD